MVLLLRDPPKMKGETEKKAGRQLLNCKNFKAKSKSGVNPSQAVDTFGAEQQLSMLSIVAAMLCGLSFCN